MGVTFFARFRSAEGVDISWAMRPQPARVGDDSDGGRLVGRPFPVIVFAPG